jgi:hypothetical protein
MATFLTLAIIMGAVAVIGLGALLKLSCAIHQEDRTRGSLRFDPPSYSTRAARTLVGVTSSRWD